MHSGHALIEPLARHIDVSDKTWLERTFWLRYEMARGDGESPSDPAGFAARLTRAPTKLAA